LCGDFDTACGGMRPGAKKIASAGCKISGAD